MDIAKVYSSDGVLKPLKTQEYTFDRVNQMEEQEVTTHLTYFAFVLKSLMEDDHEYTNANGSKIMKTKTVFEVQKVKEPKTRFKTWVDMMSLPIKPESLHKLAFEMAYNYGLRLNQDPTKVQANLNAMNNCLIVLSKRELVEALTYFQAWVTENFGDIDTMVGYLVTIKTIEFVGHGMRRTDEIVAYANYFCLRQQDTQTSTRIT